VPSTDAAPVCQPQLLAAAEQLFTSARYGIDDRRELLFAFDFPDGPAGIDWDAGTALDLSAGELGSDAVPGARFAELPPTALEPKAYLSWERDFKRWLRQNKTMTLYRSRRFKLTSAPGETEGEFRVRIQDAASEQRDLAIAKIRKRYASKLTTLENRLLRANQALEREQEQAAQKTLDTVVSVGSAILGAVLGRKKLSSATTGKIGTAIKSAGTAKKESGDVERAEQTVEKVTADIMAMNEALEREILELDTAVDAQAEELEEIVLRAKSTDIGVTAFGLGWLPYTADGEQRLEPAFPRRSHRSPA
jgi:Sec-independent protein translocase protein TatA